MQTPFYLAYSKLSLEKNAYNHIRCYTHQQRFFNNNPACTYSSWNNASWTYCTILCHANKWQRYFRILELQPTFIFTFYLWCLVVIPQPFAGTERFLAGLFTISSRLPIANWLRTSGRNWLINIIRSRTKQIWVTGLPSSTLCWAATCGWSCMQMNSSKLVMRLETDIGSELAKFLPTGSVQCHTPWYGCCQSLFALTTDFTPRCQRKREWVKERPLKALNQTHSASVIQIWTFLQIVKCMGFEQLCERGLFCTKKHTPLFLHICNPWLSFSFDTTMNSKCGQGHQKSKTLSSMSWTDEV